VKQKGIPKYYVYLLLILAATIPLFFNIPVPGKPSDASVDAFKALMSLKEGDKVLIASDWTGSTRGESKAHMKSILRLLMRKQIKFAIWSSADPQSPRCAIDVVNEVNSEEGGKYKRWNDWVLCGYYPNADVAINAAGSDIRKAFGTRKETTPEGQLKPVFESPVLNMIKDVKDFALVLDVTASKTSDFHVQFMSSKAKLLFAVTGVMVPETQVYYNSGQCVGFLGGLQGVFDLEQMMENGLNVPGEGGKPKISSTKVKEQITGFPGQNNLGNGTKYYPTLHFALLLMIVLIVIGNIEMLKAKKQGGGAK
jgi:hypothetical protein